jgi:orotidine-5'-phosphate decarboxylase
MSERNFMSLLKKRWEHGKMLCVGLDTVLEKIPHYVRAHAIDDMRTIRDFNERIVDATAQYVCAFKPNRAFYDVEGDDGREALMDTIDYIQGNYPDIPVILDQKRDDIGKTNIQYVRELYNSLHRNHAPYPADGVTVHPYLGQTALRPFLDCADMGIAVLCKTSNPGSEEFQDLRVEVNFDGNWATAISEKKSEVNDLGWTQLESSTWLVPLYQYVALRVKNNWNGNNNCALVVGATYPDQLRFVRRLVGSGFPLLVPGVGTQGGDLQQVLENGLDSNGEGLIINASSSIIYASKGEDFAEAAGREAKKIDDAIQEFLKKRRTN